MKRRMNRLSIFDLDTLSPLDHPRSIYLRFSDGNAGTGDSGGAGGEKGDAGSSNADGSKSGAAADSAKDDAGDSGQKPEKQDRTFTQAEVNIMMAAEKNQGRQAALKELGITDPAQAKALLEMATKMADATKPADQKLDEKGQETLKEKQRADKAERKLELVIAKAKSERLDDVLILAEARMTEQIDFKAAVQLVKKDMPQFFEDSSAGDGTGQPPRNQRGKGDSKNSYGARAAAINKAQKGGQSSFFKNT